MRASSPSAPPTQHCPQPCPNHHSALRIIALAPRRSRHPVPPPPPPPQSPQISSDPQHDFVLTISSSTVDVFAAGAVFGAALVVPALPLTLSAAHFTLRRPRLQPIIDKRPRWRKTRGLDQQRTYSFLAVLWARRVGGRVLYQHVLSCSQNVLQHRFCARLYRCFFCLIKYLLAFSESFAPRMASGKRK